MVCERASRSNLLCLLALLGCQEGADAPDAADVVVAPPVDCGLEIGTRGGSFAVVQLGQVVPVVMGPQGGYHITLALRAGAPRGGAYVDLEIVRGDGAVIGGARGCVRLEASSTLDGATESQDLRAIFDGTDPSMLRGEGAAVTIRARLRTGVDLLACRPPRAPTCDARASASLRAVY